MTTFKSFSQKKKKHNNFQIIILYYKLFFYFYFFIKTISTLLDGVVSLYSKLA